MKRMYEVDGPECSKRYCSLSPSSDTSSDTSSDSSSDSSSAGSPVNEPVKGKEFYEGKNGIIKLREKIISIVDPTPRTIHQYALAALRKPGTFFVQTKSELLGPFFITPSPKDIPKGELVMIYECCSVFSEARTSCFRPIGLFQH